MYQETYPLEHLEVASINLGPFGRAQVLSTVPFEHERSLYAANVRHVLAVEKGSTARVRPSRNFSGGFLTVTLPSPSRAPLLQPLHNDE